MMNGLQQKFAYVNGIRMHYVEKGAGPLVLLCHGWPESWYVWRWQPQVIARLRLTSADTGSPMPRIPSRLTIF